jgi:hypothetical protein
MSRRKFTRIVSALSLAFRGSRALSASDPEELTIPPGFTVKWDLTRDDNEVAAEFRVTEYRYYDFQILFHSTPGDTQDLFKFAGDGASVLVSKDSADSANPSIFVATNPDNPNEREQAIAAGKYVWRPKHSGVMIPVHLRVERVSTAAAPVPQIDQDFRTWNISGSFPGFSPASPGGLARQISSVKLRPGRYRLTAKTMSGIHVPAGRDTYLLATYRPNTQVLRDND